MKGARIDARAPKHINANTCCFFLKALWQYHQSLGLSLPLLAQINARIIAAACSWATGPAKILLHLSRRDLRSARQIHRLAPLLLEEIELALPVIPDHEGVDVILVDVGALLSPVLLGNNQVNVTNRLKKLLSLLIGEVTLLALLVPIELIGREGND